MHGWGSDCSIWSEWNKYFINENWNWVNSERGYGNGQPLTPNWQKSLNNGSTKRALIIHSLGLHLIEKKLLEEATHIVLIGCFSSFITEKLESKYLKIVLNRMREKIGSDNEDKMLSNFFLKAINPHSNQSIFAKRMLKNISAKGRAKLKDDLDLLIKSSILPIGFPQKAKVLVIEGELDKILSKSAKQKLITDLNSHLRMDLNIFKYEDQGHFFFSYQVIKDVENWLNKA
tara:strand:- start:336 stop:1028 length:693 start_codon:yes stop_codon:yes gene_type:complete